MAVAAFWLCDIHTATHTTILYWLQQIFLRRLTKGTPLMFDLTTANF